MHQLAHTNWALSLGTNAMDHVGPLEEPLHPWESSFPDNQITLAPKDLSDADLQSLSRAIVLPHHPHTFTGIKANSSNLTHSFAGFWSRLKTGSSLGPLREHQLQVGTARSGLTD